jgi:hypothetical protein
MIEAIIRQAEKLGLLGQLPAVDRVVVEWDGWYLLDCVSLMMFDQARS